MSTGAAITTAVSIRAQEEAVKEYINHPNRKKTVYSEQRKNVSQRESVAWEQVLGEKEEEIGPEREKHTARDRGRDRERVCVCVGWAVKEWEFVEDFDWYIWLVGCLKWAKTHHHHRNIPRSDWDRIKREMNAIRTEKRIRKTVSTNSERFYV